MTPDKRRGTMMKALLLSTICLLPNALLAQNPGNDGRWTFATRLLVTGSSDHSDPAGFQVYSSFALEAALRRSLGRSLGAELTIRTESREIDSLVPAGEDRRLGSIELLPINLFLQYRLGGGSIRPYIGAGVSATFAWEKSGLLDSTDMKGSLGPAIQLGADLDLSSSMLLNADLKWNRTRLDLKNGDITLADIRLDPLSLGLGLGFRF
jgi:outer membrane protein W